MMPFPTVFGSCQTNTTVRSGERTQRFHFLLQSYSNGGVCLLMSISIFCLRFFFFC